MNNKFVKFSSHESPQNDSYHIILKTLYQEK